MTYRLKIILRIIVILVLGSAGVYIVTQTYFWLVGLWLFLFFILAIVELIRFLEKSRRELSNFLLAIRQNDFSTTFSGKKSSSPELHYAFTVITDEFVKLRQQRESNFLFLQTVVEHLGIPMIGYIEDSGDVTLMNQAAKDLLARPFLKHIDTIKQVDENLHNHITSLKSGEKKLLKVMLHNELINLSIIAKELKLDNKLYKLISLQNIKSELDEKELESWQKLIRVLTHEIKNSAIPISTLTEVINQMITGEDGTLKDLASLEKEDLDDLHVGIKTVEKRSKGLVNFVNAYGELARVPQPKLEKLNSKALIEDVYSLLKEEVKRSKIEVNLSLAAIDFMADPELIEQVLINLIKNAREALENQSNPQITLSCGLKSDRLMIAIHDNGPGIDQETLDNIFVPFFTTKKQGSGIGLSLSKQIMRAHKGDISVKSLPGEGTSFYLIF